MAELLGGDIEQHVLAAGIVLGKSLREIPHGRSQLAVSAAELFEEQGGQRRIGLADSHRVLQPLAMHEHRVSPG